MFSGTDAILIPPRVRDGEPDVATVAIGEGAPGELVVTCRVCQRAHAKYTCPRCFIRYCGLNCYKAHDGRCVESFHGENFGDALKGTRAEDEGKKRMTEILARFARMDAGDAGFQGDKVDSDDDDEDGEDGEFDGGGEYAAFDEDDDAADNEDDDSYDDKDETQMMMLPKMTRTMTTMMTKMRRK